MQNDNNDPHCSKHISTAPLYFLNLLLAPRFLLLRIQSIFQHLTYQRIVEMRTKQEPRSAYPTKCDECDHRRTRLKVSRIHWLLWDIATQIWKMNKRNGSLRFWKNTVQLRFRSIFGLNSILTFRSRKLFIYLIFAYWWRWYWKWKCVASICERPWLYLKVVLSYELISFDITECEKMLVVDKILFNSNQRRGWRFRRSH